MQIIPGGLYRLDDLARVSLHIPNQEIELGHHQSERFKPGGIRHCLLVLVKTPWQHTTATSITALFQQ